MEKIFNLFLVTILAFVAVVLTRLTVSGGLGMVMNMTNFTIVGIIAIALVWNYFCEQKTRMLATVLILSLSIPSGEWVNFVSKLSPDELASLTQTESKATMVAYNDMTSTDFH